MNFKQQIQEAYEAGYYRALNEYATTPTESPMPTDLPEYSPIKQDGSPDFERMTPAQREEYWKRKLLQHMRKNFPTHRWKYLR